MPRLLSILCLLAALLLPGGAPSAAPVLVIHDRVDIVMDPVRRNGEQAFVRGRLVERASAQGAPYERVRVRVDANEATILTDGAGYFSHSFLIDEGQHLLSVDFPGSEALDPGHFEMADFDIRKSPLALTLQVPKQVEDTSEEFVVNLRARSENAAPAPLSMQLFYGNAGQPLEMLSSTRTDAEGLANFAIPQSDFGVPGRKRIEVRFAGDSSYDGAKAAANINIKASSSLSLSVDKEEYDYGDTMSAVGRLLDGRGDAIPSAVVGLEVKGQRVANAKTDERGDFSMRLDTEELGSGSTALQAVYRPSEALKSASRSQPVTVVVGERKPIPISYTLAAFALTSIALLSFVAMRTRPWERWMRRESDERDESSPEGRMRDATPVHGLAIAKPKLSSSLRRASFRDFNGIVQNAVTRAPIADADILIASPESLELFSEEDGRFSITQLSEGSYPVTVRAFGFVTESFSLLIPHRGEFHGAHVNMLPVREKIFSLYKRAVRYRLPDPALWGIWTPRQILDHVRASKPSESLSQLTDFVEETFFSQRTPGEELLATAEEKIAAAESEASGGKRPPS